MQYKQYGPYKRRCRFSLLRRQCCFQGYVSVFRVYYAQYASQENMIELCSFNYWKSTFVYIPISLSALSIDAHPHLQAKACGYLYI